MAYDRFTAKQIDSPLDNLPKQLDEDCDHCGTKLIVRCLRCGAPICCPKCCDEDSFGNGVQAAAGGLTQTPLEW